MYMSSRMPQTRNSRGKRLDAALNRNVKSASITELATDMEAMSNSNSNH